MNFFPSNLKILRKQSGLKQSEIPEKLGVSRTTWSNYENAVSQPSIEGLIEIANFFGVSVSDLLEKPLLENNEHVIFHHPLLTLKTVPPNTLKGVTINGSMWERTTTW